jgi:hypothetical protein
MGVRSRYKEQIAAEKAAEEITPRPSEKFKVELADAAVDDKTAPGPMDEATLRLQNQINELKKSEALQYQVAEQAQRAVAVEQQFVQAHPELLEHPKLTEWAVAVALQHGYQRGTPDFLDVTKQLFDRQMAAQANAAPATQQSEPAAPEPPHQVQEAPMPNHPFHQRPPPPPPEPSEQSASIYSAPVSREASGGGYRQSSPSSVRLSPDQREAAKMSGVTETEYARQLQKLYEAKRDEDRYSERRYR